MKTFIEATLIFLLVVLTGAAAFAGDESRRWGMIGAPPLPDRVSIDPGHIDADGYQVVHLRFGEEVPEWALGLGAGRADF